MKHNLKLKFLYFFAFFFLIFLFFISLPKNIFATVYYDCTMPMSSCQAAKGSPNNTCCHNTGGCTGTPCRGTILWYSWCYASQCCGYYDDSDVNCYSGSWACYYNIDYFYIYRQCSAVDTCSGDIYLRAGICAGSGCAKGGNYKSVCCRTGGCSSLCGTLDKWEYCLVRCCYYSPSSCSNPECIPGTSVCYCNVRWYYSKIKCSVADSCRLNTPYLYPGFYLDSGICIYQINSGLPVLRLS